MTKLDDWANFDREAAQDGEFEAAGWAPGHFDTTMINPERGEVSIPVYGYRRGGLGIHAATYPDAGGWNLTALGNGYRIGLLPTAEAARACASEIADLADWGAMTIAEANTRGTGFGAQVVAAVRRAGSLATTFDATR